MGLPTPQVTRPAWRLMHTCLCADGLHTNQPNFPTMNILSTIDCPLCPLLDGTPLRALPVRDLWRLHAAQFCPSPPSTLLRLQRASSLLEELQCSDLAHVRDVVVASDWTYAEKARTLRVIASLLLTARLQVWDEDTDWAEQIDDCAGAAHAFSKMAPRNAAMRR
jgi:hypothetical protein